MNNHDVFAGRVFFDHLPKTAGTAVYSWLLERLGSGCVTPQLDGNCSELIQRFGGNYSIISAHTFYEAGETLDPRYQYVTCIREPVERALSWLYYVINDFEPTSLPGLYRHVVEFLESDGRILSDELLPSISDLYVNHFSGIGLTPSESDRVNVHRCVDIASQFDLIGLQNDLPSFTRDFAKLLGITGPSEIPRQRVNAFRPKVNEISTKLKHRIAGLNALDSEFFEQIGKWKKSFAEDPEPLPTAPNVRGWRKFERINFRHLATPDLLISKASILEGSLIKNGQVATLQLDIFIARPIEDLAMGVHIYDENLGRAFGTNSVLLKQAFEKVPTGSYTVTYHIIADLPSGTYSVGFAFSERMGDEYRKLAWQDSLCHFQVQYDVDQEYAGSSYLPTVMSLTSTESHTKRSIVDLPKGKLVARGRLDQVSINQELSIAVEVSNESDDDWQGDDFRPISFAYRWLHHESSVLVDGIRTPLPQGQVRKRSTASGNISVVAPGNPGQYVLTLTLVQEHVGWFENLGVDFLPAKLQVQVLDWPEMAMPSRTRA